MGERDSAARYRDFSGNGDFADGARSTQGFPVFRRDRWRDDVAENLAGALHASHPVRFSLPGRRKDLRNWFAEAGYQQGCPGFAHPGERGEAPALEFGNLHLFHATKLTWSKNMVNFVCCCRTLLQQSQLWHGSLLNREACLADLSSDISNFTGVKRAAVAPS